jgi:hypothetical protein
MKIFLSLFFAVLCPLSAQSSAEHYPELMVAPKATDRLVIEARHEQKNWAMFLPMQISGATTLLAGVMAQSSLNEDKDEKGIGPKLAMVVGVSWLAASSWMQNSYRPYLKGFRRTHKLPYKSDQEKLTAERLAEEELFAAARVARKMKWASFITNAGASVYALSSSEKDSAGQGLSALALATSALPLLFPLRWEQVAEDHQSYKKKIFGPINVTQSMLFDPVTLKPVLGIMAGTTF